MPQLLTCVFKSRNSGSLAVHCLLLSIIHVNSKPLPITYTISVLLQISQRTNLVVLLCTQNSFLKSVFMRYFFAIEEFLQFWYLIILIFSFGIFFFLQTEFLCIVKSRGQPATHIVGQNGLEQNASQILVLKACATLLNFWCWSLTFLFYLLL